MLLLLIRRLHRLRPPRRLAAAEPCTITRLPGAPRLFDAEQPLLATGPVDTSPIRRAEPAPDEAELAVKAWLHQYGRRRDTGCGAAVEQL
ncbi:hypothetical protein [Streptomyces sp. NPDC097619]|uniref:hypothetical protein n=1 Tax=Streptomyces sp. NPDC097619 TaxID=3157228 RepID=UPI003320E9E1